MKTAGVYAIKNKVNGKLYVGSGVDMNNRWSVHLFLLRHGRHHSSYLQRAWNKYGEAQFEFVVLERVRDKQQLLVREQEHMDRLRTVDANYGYNMCPLAQSALGLKRSAEQLTRMRLTAKERANRPDQRALYSARAKEQWRTRRTEMLAYAAEGRRKTNPSAILKLNWEVRRDVMLGAGRASVEARKRLWKDPVWRAKMSAVLRLNAQRGAVKRSVLLRKAWKEGRYANRVVPNLFVSKPETAY